MRGVDIASYKLQELVEAGDVAAIKYFLERKGGWARESSPGVSVNVNVAGATAAIDTSNVDQVSQEHSLLLDRTFDAETGGIVG
jgi:hypothetical protein